MAKTLQEMIAEQEKRAGLPAGALASINKQETGGNEDYIKDPAKYHYALNAEGKRIAGHTGKVSTAFGPFGILESTAKNPGYGVTPLANKTLEEQVRFAADYLAGRSKAAGSLQAGLAGYGEGDAYAKQVMGRMGSVPAVAPKPDLPAPTTYDWPILPTAKNAASGPAAPTDTWASKTEDRRTQALGTAGTATALAGTDDVSRAQTQQNIDASVAAQAARDAVGIGDVFQAGRRDSRMQPMFTLLDHFNKEPEPEGTSPTYYQEIQDEIEAGKSDEERAYLRENVRGPNSRMASEAQLAYRRELDATYANAGGFAGFAGQMAAGMLDPIGFAAGMGVGKALQGVGIGSRALANAGRARAAAGSFLLENALANVSVEVMQDALGEVKGTGDYAIAAAMGVAMSLPFVRGATRVNHTDNIRAITNDMRGKATKEQLNDMAKDYLDTGITDPAVLARRLEEREIDALVNTIDEARPLREAIVPEALQREQRDLAEGKGPDEATKPTDAKLDDAEFDSLFGKPYEPAQPGQPTQPGQPLKVPYGLTKEKARVENVGGMLSSLKTSSIESIAAAAKYLDGIISKEVRGVPVRRSMDERGTWDPNTQSMVVPRDDHKAGQMHVEYVKIHEAVHAATWAKLEAVRTGDRSNATVTAAYDGIDSLMNRLKAAVPDAQHGAGYATKNVHEFTAQVLSDPRTREVLATLPGGVVDGYKAPNALMEFLGLVAKALGIKSKGTALEEAVMHIDNLLRADAQVVDANNAQVVSSGVSPHQQAAFTRRFAEGLFNHAADYMQRNPIDTKRLKVLTSKIGGMSDGLVMAASKNPVVQMLASLVAETTTGAAGRKPSVAIRANLLNKKYMGNAIPEYTSNFDIWANANSKGVWDRAVGGDAQREFGKHVYTETINRRLAGYVPNPDQAIVKAADALEGVFERARIGQVSAGTLGADNLPTTSKGYMPQALDGYKLQTLDAATLTDFHAALSHQFMSRLGWDRRFAEAFAPYYTDRVRKRALGSKQIDVQSAGGASNDVIRDTLEIMANDPRQRDHAAAAGALAKGLGHTKKRLDLDLQASFAGGQLMDMYVTDPLALARNYSRRNAGMTAFAESGVLGTQGIQALRDAAERPFVTGTEATHEELKAFDRVVAEIMGNPVEGAVISAGATNLSLAVQVSKLGGLVFTQAAETMQLIHSLGVASALNGIASLPKMLGEVGRLKKGMPANNHILTSIETYGGEFGMESYKMVAPLDPPDNALNQYMDQAGIVTRLLRGAGHLQSKISGFRGLMAAQHRMAAEQVVMKAARYIRDGGEDVALRDMGFTDEVVAAMRNDLQHVAQFDQNGKLTSFDLSQVTDPATAEAFVQATHRGVSQIIQGTFPGERNKWFHNDYLKTMLQLRTFGLTATEKQWGRSQSNHGTMYTVGMLAGQMALALPIHLARVHAAAAGREDKEQFLKDNLSPVALARATMNYSSLSGLMGDVMDVGTGIWSGWGSDESKELLGGRQQATGVANIVPALGMVDAGLKAAQGKSTMYNAVKQLPFANLWYMVPLINQLKE